MSPPRELERDDRLAMDIFKAIRFGEVELLARLLLENEGLAATRIVAPDGASRTPLHIVTDWPGYFPAGPQSARMLIDAGADVDARTTGRGGVVGPGSETPLHWAASSDDSHVAAVLIAAGADLETPDGSIGSPLDNAVGYGCWRVARMLIDAGARVDKLWHAAALGLIERLEELLAASSAPDVVSEAFWHACSGGQRRAAEQLLARGADLDWSPEYAHGTALDAARGLGTQRQNVISWLEEKGARSQADPRS